MYQAGIETHPLKGPFTLVLALRQVVLAVIPVAIRPEVGVVLRAPIAVVDAVDDAPQLPAVLPQAPVQAPAALLRLALPGIPACMAQALRMEVFHRCKGQMLACPANETAWTVEGDTVLKMLSACSFRASFTEVTIACDAAVHTKEVAIAGSSVQDSHSVCCAGKAGV